MTTLPTWTPFRREGERVVVADQAEWEVPFRHNLSTEVFGSAKVLLAVDGDPFEPGMDAVILHRLFATIDACPDVTFIIRTSHPERVREAWPINLMATVGPKDAGDFTDRRFPNVILLANATTQAELDQRAEQVAKCGGLCVFVGAWLEPVEQLDVSRFLPHWLYECQKCGASGESIGKPGDPCGCEPAEGFESEGDCDGHLESTRGDGLKLVVVQGTDRPLHPSIVRSLRDQCAAADVCFNFQSWGDWWPFFGQDDDMAETFADVNGWQSTSDHGPFPPGFDSVNPTVDEHRWPEADYVNHADKMASSFKVGRSASGSTIDGVTWDRWPEVKHV